MVIYLKKKRRRFSKKLWIASTVDEACSIARVNIVPGAGE
jgi:hypothetical protein